MKRALSVFAKHQLKIARKTLTYNDATVAVLGYPNKAQAQQIIKHLTGKEPKCTE